MAEHTINSRARNLGYGWSTQPTGRDSMSIENPTRPDVTGGLRSVEAGMYHCSKIVSGGVYYNQRLFVAGQPITEIYDFYTIHTKDCPYMAGDSFRCSPSCILKQGWLDANSPAIGVNELVRRLRNGETLIVRTEDTKEKKHGH